MTGKIRNVIIFIVLLLFIISIPLTRVKVKCRAQNGDCPEETKKKLESLSGKRLYQAKSGAVSALKKDFLILEYSTQLKLPNVLVVNVIIKKPEFAIFDKSSGKYLLIDKSGLLLAYAQKPGVPFVIKNEVKVNMGQKVGESDLNALKIVRGLYGTYQVGSGMIENDTLLVDLPRGIRVIFPLIEVEVDVLLGSLRLIYAKLTQSDTLNYSQIDMRYKNPVLRK